MSVRGAFFRKLSGVLLLLLVLLLLSMMLGICLGSSENDFQRVFRVLLDPTPEDSTLRSIIWHIRLPRVLLAVSVGAALSLGGLVFQALLKNPLAEPYILGISGGSAIGAILGILMGLSRFPGVTATAFVGSMGTLALILFMNSGRSFLKKESLLLSGVMVNAFCSAVIMFLVSLTQDARLHNIIFWLMGDLSQGDISQVTLLVGLVLPCFMIVFYLSNAMNLLLMGSDIAQTAGLNIKRVSITLLVATSFMVSSTVSYCGLLGFVGLVMPHTLRLLLGPDHRILVPACVLGGSTFMVLCDVLARTLPKQGEMPAGVVTAMIGAPAFIFLLRRSN